MSVPAIGPVSGVTATGFIDNLEPGAGTGSSTGASFGASLAAAVDGVSAAQSRSAELGVQAVSGELENVHEYTIAATEAQVALELTAAVRNKAVGAFNEIMRMQA